ncbi:MAG: LPS export ABC transporter periplasmic protein LptC [Gammaproteobacteria bacterium]|nr:MAG: LPS export ABC transporter periplasmic protein LptC [Gammaproteobacteria bacterium]
MIPARWRLPLLLLCLALGSAWLLERLRERATARQAVEQHHPDLYMENFVRLGMDKEGRLRNRLRATRLMHYPDDDTTEMIRPRLQVISGDGVPMFVTADRAWASSDNEVILLYGEVRIWRNRPDGERELELITSDLKVLPEEEYAETEEPVTIIGDRMVTDATGLRADLARRRLKLLHKVRSRYETSPRL